MRQAVSSRPPQIWSLQRREAITFYLLISPWLIGLLVFVAGPMLASLAISFTDYDFFSAPEFIGLRNYADMLDDPLVGQALKVTLLYTLLYLPTELIGGLGLALIMNQRLRGISFFRAIFYLPTVLSGVAFVVVWIFLLRLDGLVNGLLSLFGVRGPNWLNDPNTALISLWLMSIWGLGRAAVIYLAGLQGIPRTLIEAAAIDGANRRQILRRVIIPLLTPTIFFNLILSLISTFQTFTSAYVVSNGRGDPLYATLFFVLYLYQQAFQRFKMGYASALAWVLFLVIFVLTLLLVRSARRWVFYEGERE